MKQLLRQWGICWLMASACTSALAVDRHAPSGKPELVRRLRALSPEAKWFERPAIRLGFDAHHPQGLVKVGHSFYLSSVEVLRKPEAIDPGRGGFDRGPGQGVGHLFRFDHNGFLKEDLRLGEGTSYHPGGMDFDGRNLWVPVAEYRPRGASVVYRISLDPLRSEKVFNYPDHIGAVAFDPMTRELHGFSWGSRNFYRWRIPRRGRIRDAEISPMALRRPNPSFYIDYQDCKWIGDGLMVCSGLRSYPNVATGGPVFSLGGIDLVQPSIPGPVHQIPVIRRSDSGRVITQNAFWVESVPGGLRFWFVPDDGPSLVRVFDVSIDLKDSAVPAAPGRR
jgi:hypothetical protein